MVVSSLVVSYVTDSQNVSATNANLVPLTTDIAAQMETVNQASTKMSENCKQITEDTREMGTQTGKLDNLINRFVIK